MPLSFLRRNDRSRLAFRFGRATLRSTNDLVEQLQQQLEFERQEHEREKAILIRGLMQAKYELARREVVDAFAVAPSASEMKH